MVAIPLDLVVAAISIYLVGLLVLAALGSVVKEADETASELLDEERRRREPHELDRRRHRRRR